MIEVGANKQKLKRHLIEKRGPDTPTVLLKSLHNLQTNIRKVSNHQTDFENLLEEMAKIPNATIKVAVDNNNEILGIYFQDQRMAKLYAMYPEVIIVDATYKLNNRRMPLFLMLVIDGNGESKLACFWILKSESRESIDPMLKFFKEHNEKWVDTKVIGDKDFADRSIFKEHECSN